MLKICGTAGPSSGSLFLDLAGEGLAREWIWGVAVVPAADERVSFEEDIKPLFRAMDHESMAWAFDLASYDEVNENAMAILERLRDGSMPCDGEWPEEQVERFQRWTETGMHEYRRLDSHVDHDGSRAEVRLSKPRLSGENGPRRAGAG
jgi:hypothetical protein